MLDEHGDQLLAAEGQVQERLAKRRAGLGRQQVMLGGPGLLIGDGLRMRHRPGRAGWLRRARGPPAFPPGRGGQPAGQRRRLRAGVQVICQLQPDAPPGIAGLGAA